MEDLNMKTETRTHMKKEFSYEERRALVDAISISGAILGAVKRDGVIYNEEWISEKIALVDKAWEVLWGDLVIPDAPKKSIEEELEENPAGWEAV